MNNNIQNLNSKDGKVRLQIQKGCRPISKKWQNLKKKTKNTWKRRSKRDRWDAEFDRDRAQIREKIANKKKTFDDLTSEVQDVNQDLGNSGVVESSPGQKKNELKEWCKDNPWKLAGIITCVCIPIFGWLAGTIWITVHYHREDKSYQLPVVNDQNPSLENDL